MNLLDIFNIDFEYIIGSEKAKKFFLSKTSSKNTNYFLRGGFKPGAHEVILAARFFCENDVCKIYHTDFVYSLTAPLTFFLYQALLK